jgi:cytochrome c oxidase assembly protein subunit 15
VHRFAVVTAGATLVLIFVGALVTSTGSGLAVPDWPTSYGWNMFTFPPAMWVGGILYEHSHRLIASAVGCLTIVLAVWLWLADPRRWMKRLGVFALGTVILQGLLGGLTVLFFLPAAVSIAHAGLAELFLCLTVAIAVFSAPGWIRGSAQVEDVRLRRATLITTGLIYVQILVGAVMRHTEAGLAIPDFPLMFGGFLPDRWDFQIGVHFAHRVGTLVVTLAILATVARVWSRHHRQRGLTGPSTLLVALLGGQIALGAFTIWSHRAVWITSAHVLCGALVLVTSLVLTLRSWRVKFAESPIGLEGNTAFAARSVGIPPWRAASAGAEDLSIAGPSAVAEASADRGSSGKGRPANRGLSGGGHGIERASA